LIKEIKGSLTIKIFIVTSLLLAFCCALTYGCIAWLMPKTYSTNMDSLLEKKIENFISDLENTTLEDSKDLFDTFLLSNDIVIQLHDSFEQEIPIPSHINITTDEEGNHGAIMSDETIRYSTDEKKDYYIEKDNGTQIVTMPSTLFTAGSSRSYLFTFSDSEEQYRLTVWIGTKAVNQVIEALGNILPWLFFIILAMSIIASLVYSIFVTRPVIKLSGISQKMSTLDLDWHCDENRNDELGILAQSLNNFSIKLSNALNDLQNANTKLQDDIDKEKKMEQARLEFFSAVSHELKTPITIIKGQLEGMLLNVGTYKDRDKYLARSLEVANGLENMVQEILTVSRIESSGIMLHIEELNLGEMVKRRLSTLEDLFIRKQLLLHIDMEDSLHLNGDKMLLQKVINNLVENAIHYSPAGSNIFIKGWSADDHVNFIIENTGVHIPEADFPKLFEAFYRVDQSRNRQMGGSGLGLYIVKMILDRHKAAYIIENTAAGVQFRINFD